MTEAGEAWIDKLSNDCLGALKLSGFDVPVWSDAYDHHVAELWIRIFSKRVNEFACEYLEAYVKLHGEPKPEAEAELKAVCRSLAFGVVYEELIGCAPDAVQLKSKGEENVSS
jgi:hypothetical protein